MAHGFCHYGRNIKNIEKGQDHIFEVSNKNLSMPLFNLEQLDSLTIRQAYPTPRSDITLQYDILNNSKPLVPCYIIPSLKCEYCHLKNPKNEVLSYVNDAQNAYHGSSKWN